MIPARTIAVTATAVVLAAGALAYTATGDVGATSTSMHSSDPRIPAATPEVSLPAVLRQDCTPYGVNRPEPNPHRNFYFTRGAYSSSPWSWRGRSWSTDYPKADQQFLYVMARTLGWDIHACENPIRLDDPHLRRFPFLYMLEVGNMGLTEAEVLGLRDYLLAGGFLFIDDFWGPNEWANFEREILQVLPGRKIDEIPMDHLIFRIIYPIEEVLQVPNVGNGATGNPQYYGECYYGGACTATVRGIFDDDGRLMVVIAHNSDLGDAWEWAEQPSYPYDRSNFAFSLAFNIIAYAMAY